MAHKFVFRKHSSNLDVTAAGEEDDFVRKPRVIKADEHVCAPWPMRTLDFAPAEKVDCDCLEGLEVQRRRRASFTSLSTIDSSTIEEPINNLTNPGVRPEGVSARMWTRIVRMWRRLSEYLRRLVRFALCIKASVTN